MSSFFTPRKKRPRYSLPARTLTPATPSADYTAPLPQPLPAPMPRYDSLLTATPASTALVTHPHNDSHSRSYDALIDAAMSGADTASVELSARVSALETELSELRSRHREEIFDFKRNEVDTHTQLIRQIADLESRLRLATEAEESRRLHEEETSRLRREKDYEKDARIAELEMKLVYLVDLESTRQNQFEQSQSINQRQQSIGSERESQSRLELAEANARIEMLQEKDSKAEEKLFNTRNVYEKEVELLQFQLAESASANAACSATSEKLRQELQLFEELESKRQHDESSRQDRERELLLATESITYKLQRANEIDQLYRQSRDEIVSLQSQVQNNEILNEKILSLSEKIQRLEGENEKLISLTVEGEQLKAVIANVTNIPNLSSASIQGVRSALYQMKEERQEQQAITTSLQSTVESLTQQINDNHSKLQRLTDANINNESALIAAKSECAVLVERLSTLTRECEGLNRLLASYEADNADANDAQSQQILLLKSELVAARAENSTLVQRLSSLTMLQGEHDRLTRALADSQSLVNTLQSRPATENMEGVKVFHLADNPLMLTQRARFQSIIDQLTAEIRELKARLTAATNAAANTDSDPSMVAVDSERVLSLERQLHESQSRYIALEADTAKRYDRLKSVFAEKVKEFRDGCYRLIGYKIEIAGDTWRLKPIHAASATDIIIFKKRSEGEFSLCQTDLIASLSSDTVDHLHVWHDVPMFLAATILELGARQTRRQ